MFLRSCCWPPVLLSRRWGKFDRLRKWPQIVSCACSRLPGRTTSTRLRANSWFMLSAGISADRERLEWGDVSQRSPACRSSAGSSSTPVAVRCRDHLHRQNLSSGLSVLRWQNCLAGRL